MSGMTPNPRLGLQASQSVSSRGAINESSRWSPSGGSPSAHTGASPPLYMAPAGAAGGLAAAISSHSSLLDGGGGAEDDALVLRVVKEIDGLFGIGLQLDDKPPYAVLRNPTNLMDATGSPFAEGVIVKGNRVTHINAKPLPAAGLDAAGIRELVLGPRGTTVRLTLLPTEGRGNTPFHVVVQRHIAVDTWEVEKKWYELRPLQGRSIQASAHIVDHLNSALECVEETDPIVSHVQAAIGCLKASGGGGLSQAYVDAQISHKDALLRNLEQQAQELRRKLDDAVPKSDYDALCQRKAELDASLSATIASSVPKGEHDALLQLLAESRKEGDALRRASSELGIKVSGLEGDVSAVSRERDALLLRVDSMEERAVSAGLRAEIQQLMNAAEAAAAKGKETMQQLNDARGEVAALNHRILDMVPRKELAQCKTQIASLESRAAALTDDVSSERDAKGASEARCAELKRQLSDARAKLAEAASLAGDLARSHEESEGLRGQVKQAQAALESSRKACKRLEDEMGDMVPRKEAQQWKDAAAKEKAEAARAREEVAKRQSEVDTALGRLKEVGIKRERAEKERDEEKSKLDTAERSLDEARSELQQMERIKAQAKASELKYAEAGNRIAELEARIGQMAPIDKLRRSEAGLEERSGEVLRLQEALSAAEEKAKANAARLEGLVAELERRLEDAARQADEKERHAKAKHCEEVDGLSARLREAERCLVEAREEAKSVKSQLEASKEEREAEARRAEEGLRKALASAESEHQKAVAGYVAAEKVTSAAMDRLRASQSEALQRTAHAEADLKLLQAEHATSETRIRGLEAVERRLSDDCEMQRQKLNLLSVRVDEQEREIGERVAAASRLAKVLARGGLGDIEVLGMLCDAIGTEKAMDPEEVSVLLANVREHAGASPPRVSALLSLVAGPPKETVQDLTDVAEALVTGKGGCKRTLADGKRLLLLLNRGEAWSVRDLEALRDAMGGMSPQELIDLLAACGSLDELLLLRERVDLLASRNAVLEEECAPLPWLACLDVPPPKAPVRTPPKAAVSPSNGERGRKRGGVGDNFADKGGDLVLTDRIVRPGIYVSTREGVAGWEGMADGDVFIAM